MNLIILTPDDMTSPNRCVLADHRATHLHTVLRVQPGETVRVGMLNGKIGSAEIISVADKGVELSCVFEHEPPAIYPTVDLICAVPRPKTIRKVLFVSAMMGVRRLVFIRTNRTDKSYLSSPLLTPDGARPHLLDGLAQGGLTRLPEVHLQPLFRPFVEDQLDQFFGPPENHFRLLSDPSAVHTLVTVWGDCDKNHIVAAIGPEGGWVPFESGLLAQQRFVGFSLGPWTLRVEFAVTAILAQVHLVARRRV